MRIRLIENTDNVKIATVIRSVIIEMGVPKVGTAYEDVELDNMFQAYQKNHFVYYVVEDGDRVLGGAGIAPLKNSSPSICELQKMYFLSEARGKGIGKRMIEKCLSFAKANDYEKCYIETMPNMQDAQKLYIKSGFEYIDSSMGNTGHSSCPIWMLKSL